MNKFLFSLLVTFSLSGCATIMHGTDQSLTVSSTPPGAAVMVNGVKMGTTPMAIELDRGDQHFVTVAKDGFTPAEFTVTKEVSGWAWGNIFLGGLIGLAVDAATGGLYNLEPTRLDADMQAVKAPDAPAQAVSALTN